MPYSLTASDTDMPVIDGSNISLETRWRKRANATTTTTPDVGDSGTIYTNVGAGSLVTINLPEIGSADASAVRLGAHVYSTNGIRLDAYSGDLIMGPGWQTVTGGYVESTEAGAFVELVQTANNTWSVMAIGGTWTVEDS